MPPLKRHPALQPLSREHHEILLAVWKLRQGLSLGVAPKRIADYLKDFSENYLRPHILREQRMLAMMPAGDLLTASYQARIKQIDACIGTVMASPDTEKIEQLSNLIYDTVRFEERELFMHAQMLLTDAQFNSLLQQPDWERGPCPLWPDEFWLNK